jgi:hypothetical protein
MGIARETYRQARVEQYKNYENIPNSGEEATKVHPINQLTFHRKSTHYIGCYSGVKAGMQIY